MEWIKIIDWERKLPKATVEFKYPDRSNRFLAIFHGIRSFFQITYGVDNNVHEINIIA